ncbi:transcription initiation factor TFIID subunit 12b [Asparagus officinalis]|nr:transcription initiation factor TFIID subunit 12b [Asparagus officinalis]
MGMMGSLGVNQQLRANGPLSYGQRFTNSQIRQQQISMQNPLSSPQKLSGQGLPRGSSLASMNAQFSGLTQNGQPTSVQNALAQQPWLKQMQQTVSSPVSPSQHLQQQQRQQQAFSPQQTSSAQLQLQKSMGLNQQQISQLVQQQQLGSPRQHQTQQQQLIQHQQQQMQLQQLQLFQQLQQQQQSPRMQGSGFQKSISLTGSQPGTPASVTTNTGGNSSQGAETSSQLLGKRKIQDLVSQVDPHAKLDPAVEDLLLEMADDFIESVTTFACSLAKHRKSSTLESKDLLLHLEKNLRLTIPGYTKEGQTFQKEPVLKDVHNKRLESIRASVESQPFEKDANCVRNTGRQVSTDTSLNRPFKPSPSSEQLALSAAASQMLQKVPRF